MYITNGLYERHAEYIDMKDISFFHTLVELAKERYERDKELFDEFTQDDIAKIKKLSLVIYASTVSNFTNDDILILRPEMNERARRKYLIIDADFSEDQVEESESLVNKLKELASNFNTPIIIYPTMSYPSKPRFRAVLFVKNALNESTYYQAMRWLYTMLDMDALDSADYKIRSNNNAPFFVNQEQVDFVYDTTQNGELKLLDNTLWKAFEKPKLRSAKKYDESPLDKIEIADHILEEACLEFAKSESAKHFNTFWKVFHSFARAEYYGQLTNQQVIKALNWVSKVPGQEANSVKWSVENVNQYKHEKRRVFSNEKLLLSSRPLFNIKEFGQVFLKHDLLSTLED